MRTTLTDKAIAKAVCDAAADGPRDLADLGCTGLTIRVSKHGQCSWVLSCRDQQSRTRRFPLGQYPQLSIAKARNAARSLRVKVREDGADPIAERRARVQTKPEAAEPVHTLASLLDLYERQLAGRLRSWADGRRRVALVFRPLLSKPLAELTLGDLQLAADNYRAPGQASFAVRSLRPVLVWASHPGRNYVPATLRALREPAPVMRRKRVLSRQELATVLPVLRDLTRRYAVDREAAPNGAVMLFLLLTCTRLNEAASARWRDVDPTRQVWTIPETKNGEPHSVPLSTQAIELLRLLGPGAPDQLIFATSAGSVAGNWDRARRQVHAKSGTASDWHCHDLRRTSATVLGELGEPPHIIEAVLNHVAISSRLAATYNRSRYEPEKARALQKLGDALDGIAAGAAVVTLHPAIA